ncbi:MAG: hypothetical protein H8E15_09685 [Planctomycetes bacterium]|nr:hypothetical protein [Planctomycetota bacterium]
MASKILSTLSTLTVVGALFVLPSCGGGSGTNAGGQGSSGNFLLQSTNMGDGVTWELNKLVQLTFNNPVDMDTVHFGTILFSSKDVNQPVTGSFESDSEDPRTIYFRPTCPTANDNSNGGFVPGGYTYTLSIPTSTKFGAEVLRDKDGRALKQGVTRSFTSPTGAGSSLFLDYVDGPPTLLSSPSIEWPKGLNFYNDPESSIRFHFNQAIDARNLNLNLLNLYILYADGEIGTAGEDVFPVTNRLPGSIRIEENCVSTGAVVLFEIAGLLPPNRKLQAIIKRQFTDIAGQGNFADLLPATHTTPTIAKALGDSSVDWSANEVTDEYQEFFENSTRLDLSAALPLPSATIEDGYVQASFDFPGEFTTKDFYLDSGYTEISTNSQTFFTDSGNTTHTVLNGVISCRNFTIEADSELRARGSNPLVVYATGTVTLDGILNVSGNNAIWPTGLNSPQRPEGGAKGECGGGTGGTSSQEVFQETYRGSSGDGAWGFEGNGGQGGEGGFNQERYTDASYTKEAVSNTAAGGGGGTFALTDNVSIYWTRWTEDDKMPSVDKNFTMDHRLNWNTATDPQLSGSRFVYNVVGGEAGVRGSSWGSTEEDPLKPNGVYGMEDESPDLIYRPTNAAEAQDGQSGPFVERYSEPWDNTATQPNPFSNDIAGGKTLVADTVNEFPRLLGHPTKGADAGLPGPSIFSNDGTTSNDFWGVRVNNDGSVTPGELLIPWAGAGGGASGDMVIYVRGNNGDDPLTDSFPEPNFPNGRIDVYRKGAPGGGGGGQVMVMAIGDIVIGAAGKVLARGGNGMGGESIGWTYGQVSGSGGGSGGHIVLSTASKLDLSEIDILDSGQGGDQNWTIQDEDFYEIPIAGVYFTEVLVAIGGRRGWAMSQVNDADLGSGSVIDDGNETYAIGRGGAGGNGVVQIHVPDPTTDILWPVSRDSEIKNYLHNGDVNNNDLDRDRLEEILRVFAAPKPYALVPIFSAKSMFRSKWVDTGLAELRQPNVSPPVDFPNYTSSMLQLMGINSSNGSVDVDSGMVSALTQIVSGSVSDSSLFDFEAQIGNASTVFAGLEHFLRQPNLLRGYGFKPNEVLSANRTVVSASYKKSTDTLTLLTDPADGSLLVGTGLNWALLPRFFRLTTGGVLDALPAGTGVTIQFQGAEQSGAGTNVPGTPFPDTNTWTSDLSQLQGYRFIRYQVVFDIDALASGVNLATPQPLISYLKIPFTW